MINYRNEKLDRENLPANEASFPEHEPYRHLFNVVFIASSSALKWRLLIYGKCEGRKAMVKFPIMSGHVMCQIFGTCGNEFLDSLNTQLPHQLLK